MFDRVVASALLAVATLFASCADEGFGRVARIPPTLPVDPQAVIASAPGAALAPPAASASAPSPAATSGSLYNPASFTPLAGDRRARRVGDLITIRLVERTQARKSATADSSRDGDTDIRLPQAPPFSFVPPGLLQGGSTQGFTGAGSAAQDNQLFGEITVTVAAVLPGGVLRIAGEKRTWLNRGEEQLQLTGLVRIDDLGPDNSVPSTRVADARIRYSGTGQVADQSRQGWLARFFGKVAPL